MKAKRSGRKKSSKKKYVEIDVLLLSSSTLAISRCRLTNRQRINYPNDSIYPLTNATLAIRMRCTMHRSVSPDGSFAARRWIQFA
jgi:hypothetical protein